MSIEKKLIPIQFDIDGVGENNTKQELQLMVAILDAAINRCCKSCEEPIKVMTMIKENGFLNDAAGDA